MSKTYAQRQSAESRKPDEALHSVVQRTPGLTGAAPAFADNRPRAVAQRELAEKINSSPRVLQQKALFDSLANSPRAMQQKALVDQVASSPRVLQQKAFLDSVQNSPYAIAQRQRTASLFGRPAQRRETRESPGEPETAQRVAGEAAVSQRESPPGSSAPVAGPGAQPNHTGLPDGLKSGVEALSGISLDNVKVHYNSSQPAQLNALAYAQGSEIHVAPGQEKHLPHEAWHVVQQAQGRVKPTMQMKGAAINDDARLEREADAMGARATFDGQLSGSPGVHPGLADRGEPSRHAVPISRRKRSALLNVRAPVQRNKESAELLTKLAIPQIRPGPSVKVQKELVGALDQSDDFRGGILNLGGILIDGMPKSDKDLIDQAQLVDLPTSGGFISAGAPRGGKILKHGLDRLVVENTLKTMIDAGQIAYLRLAGLPNAEWKILIEVHYYRERDMSQTGFHKDTLGETLFVNLNYHMDRAVIGPEFVVNPSPSPEHDQQTEKTLPPEFRQDLAYTRETLPNPTDYGAGIAMPYDYVAFVDEAIHHATPFFHHRYVTGADLEQHLAKEYPVKLLEAKRAYEKKNLLEGFDSEVNKGIIPADEIAKWWTWMKLAADAKGRLTRNDMQGTMNDAEFDEVLATAGAKGGERTKGAAPGFYAASIPKTTNGPTPISPGKPALKRRLSDANFRKTLPPEPPEGDKRAFFRTWVRVVPEEKAKKLRKANNVGRALLMLGVVTLGLAAAYHLLSKTENT